MPKKPKRRHQRTSAVARIAVEAAKEAARVAGLNGEAENEQIARSVAAAVAREAAGKEVMARGRPPIVLDAEQLNTLDALAGIQCTYEEISAVMGISVDTLSRNYADRIEKGRERGKQSLRRAQFTTALGDASQKRPPNPTMLIWLGKNVLGQADKQELSGPQGGPIQVEDARAVLLSRIKTIAERRESMTVDAEDVEVTDA